MSIKEDKDSGNEDPGNTWDVAICVATSSEEEALKREANKRNITPRRVGERRSRSQEYYLGNLGGSRVGAFRQPEMGALGWGGAAMRTRELMALRGAQSIIGAGMAFGVDRNRQKLGDVLISTCLYPYQAHEVTGATHIQTRYSFRYTDVPSITPSETLLSRFERSSVQNGSRDFNVHFGALLTGQARIHAAAYRSHLCESFEGRDRVVVGGEMEAAGIASAFPSTSAGWIIVKGISDFADESRDTDLLMGRGVACGNALGLVLDVLMEDPQYGIT